jgi:small-conductance mechanosensitive channel
VSSAAGATSRTGVILLNRNGDPTMQILNEWGTALSEAFARFGRHAAEYLPSILGAFLLLIIGWIVARVLRTVAVRALVIVDRLLARVTVAGSAERAKLPIASAKIFGSIVFWGVLLFFVTAATQVLGLDAFTAWLAGVANYVPALLAGALIIAAGFLLSRLARDLVVATSVVAGPRQRELLGRTVQAIILVTALLVGADQIGIKVTFLVIIAAAAAGTVAVSVALALSLGARSYVANLIGAHHLRQTFAVGQRVKVAGYEGRILELTTVAMVLETDEGRVTLPGRVYGDEPIVLKIGER